MKRSGSFVHGMVAVVSAVWLVSSCQHARVASCPISAGEVLRDVNRTDVQQAEVTAWTRDLGDAVVTGQRGGKHVVIVANRDPMARASGWALASVSIMRSDGSDFWILGDRDFDHPPTHDDIDAFLKQLLGVEHEEFVFRR